MADIRAIASTAFESPLTWFGNVVPGLNDVAFSNGFTPVISTAITVQALSNASGTGIAAGGSFSFVNGGSLTFTNANGLLGSANNPVVTTASLGLGQSASISGPSANIPATAGVLINHSGSGVLTVTSNLNGSTGQTATNFGVAALTGVGTLNTIGTITGPSNVVGNGIAGGVFVSGNGVWNHTGSVVGGTNTSGINAGAYITAASANITINGSVTGGASPVFSNTARSAGVENASSSTLTINGQCQSSATQPAIGPGSISQVTRLSGPFLLGATGNINPNLAVKWGATAGSPASSMEVPNFNFTAKVSWYTANNYPVGGYPLQSNVVLGTVYGPNSEFIGTSAKPATGSVALGVAVGQATGTAILTAEDLQSALANKATVDQVAAIVQGATSA
jgi:hypothetical protein